MAETHSETTKLDHETADTSLPAVTASLEMLTVNANLTPPKKRAILRRLSRVDPNESLNRRCSLRPRKRTWPEMESSDKKKSTEKEGDIEDYYLNKNLKKKLNNLETIYEEKDDISESSVYMSVKRYKRMIQFNAKPSDSKIKKRKAKVKKVFGSKINLKRKYASMEMLLEKLNSARTDSPAKVEKEVK